MGFNYQQTNSYFRHLSPRSSSCGNLHKSVKAFQASSGIRGSRGNSRRGSTKYSHVESKVIMITRYLINVYYILNISMKYIKMSNYSKILGKEVYR